MNKYKYSFDLGAFFGSEEKETKLKAAPEVETSILPRPKQKQEAEPAYDPYGFIPDFAAAYEGAGGVPSVGSDLPLPAGEEQSRYALAVESLLDEMQGSLTLQPDLTAATPALNLEPPVVKDSKEESKPVEAETVQAAVAGVLSEVADTEDETTGGLMSPTVEKPAATTASTLTDLIYTDFVDAGQEGDEAHVGQDNKNITLPGGVVPDGLVYDGKAHTQDKSVVTNFDKSKLDTSGAYKKVGSKTIRRSDYNSDNAFAKGVIGAFKDEAKKAAGDSWDSMSEGSKKAVVKIGWNKGTGWYKGKSAKAIYKELAKEKPEPSNLYSKILVGSTVKGGGASIGIAKARANAWNETISATGGKEITKIVADNSGTNTALKYYDIEGNLLHTEQTNRSVDKYENKATTISKDSKGVW